MTRFRLHPGAVAIDAHRWFKNGDHPGDELPPEDKIVHGERPEGKMVRYFRHPNVSGDATCPHCGYPMHMHGWIDEPSYDSTPHPGQTVCPGDWIVAPPNGRHYPVKHDVWEALYRERKEDA